MKSWHVVIVVVCLVAVSPAEMSIPESRLLDWDPGVRGGIPHIQVRVNVKSYGALGNGSTDDTAAIRRAIANCPRPGAVYFPPGRYPIRGRIDIPSWIVLRGAGIDKTHILATPGASTRHAFFVSGRRGSSVRLTRSAAQWTDRITVANPGPFDVGQTIEIEMNNEPFMVDTLPGVTRGQIVKVVSKSGNTLHLDVPLRSAYPLRQAPRVYPLTPRRGVGFEDFHIRHVANDDNKSILFFFKYAVNSWVKNVESERCASQHIKLNSSRHITVRDNLIHHSYAYSAGKGYGITASENHTSDCLITNNTLYALRHSLLSSHSANGNVWSYNFSTDERSREIGLTDLDLHGNYSYMELLEGNVVLWIHLGGAHGLTGPYNTVFRNRATKWPYTLPTRLYRAGIKVNSTGTPSHSQNIIGNTSRGQFRNQNGYANSGDYAHDLWIEKNMFCRDGIIGGDLGQSTIIDNLLNCRNAAPWTIDEESFYLTRRPDFWIGTPWPATGSDVDSRRLAAGLRMMEIPAQVRYGVIMGTRKRVFMPLEIED